MNEFSILNSLFGEDGFALPNYSSMGRQPDVDVIMEKDCYVLSMDLPGRAQDEVELSLKDDMLTIASVKKEAEKKAEEKTRYLLRERSQNQFKRAFTLPKDIDNQNVTAEFKNGVLTVRIARKPEASERKISITAA